MRVSGSRLKRFLTIRLHFIIVTAAMSILVLNLLLVPQAWGGESKRDIVMMVDNSGSMKKNDPEFLAHRALKTFISTNDDDTRLALITFDKDVKLSIPFTPLTDTSRPILFDAINEIDYSGPLTNSPAALERAIFEFALHGREDADKSIIFITDGIVDTGNKARDKQQEDWMQNELSILASKLDIRIFGIAFAEAANYPLLEDLVSKTEGEYFKVYIADELPGVFARLEAISRPADRPLIQEPPKAEVDSSIRPRTEAVRNIQELDETLDAADPLNVDERLTRSQPISIPGMLLNKARRFYSGNELVIYCMILISLIALGALLLSRKSTPRTTTSRAINDPSFRDDQVEALLIDIDNHTSVRNHPLSTRITRIGRANAGTHNDEIHHLLIDKPTIGREHALIEYKDGSYWLIDNDSTNGTFIDGKRIKGRARLKDGNRIKFHDVRFLFSVPDLNNFEKTICAPIFNTREETEFDENVSLARKLESKHSLHASSMANTNINKACADIGAYRRAQENTGLNFTTEDHNYSKPISNTAKQNRNVPYGYKGPGLRSVSDSAGVKHVTKTVPDAESRSLTKRDTERLESTNTSPDTNTQELAQLSKQSGTEELKVIPRLKIKKKPADREESIREDTVELDIV